MLRYKRMYSIPGGVQNVLPHQVHAKLESMCLRKRLAGVLLLCFSVATAHGQYAHGRRTVPHTAPQAYKGLVVTFHGVLKKLSKKELILQSDDNQLMTMRCSRKTKFHSGEEEIKSSDIDLESRVAVDASEDSDLKMMALNVTVESTQKKSLGK